MDINHIDYLNELEAKQVYDHLVIVNNNSGHKNNNSRRIMSSNKPATRCVWVPGPIIIGAGPSGLAVAACLKQRGIESLILEKSNCIASLWHLKTYNRLRLHLPKQFCQLPLMPFPSNFPIYPTKEQFLDYLENYSKVFELNPVFNQNIVNAYFDQEKGAWRIKNGGGVEYESKWLIVATGENAAAVVPEIEGMCEFVGPIVHTCDYRSGENFKGKNVLVVGCGNSGMEVCLDLCNSKAKPSLVVRDSVHVLPQEMLGRSTFALSMCLLKWFPVRLVDRFLLLVSHFMIGDTSRFGLVRPKLGPLELKSHSGKTPVLDVGALAEIKSGTIKVCKGIKRLTRNTAEFVDGKVENFDAIILATGYKSNVPSWLKECQFFCKEDGLPRETFPNGWKGEFGLYAVGFTKRGLLGASMDANRIAEDIDHRRKVNTKKFISCNGIRSQELRNEKNQSFVLD